MAKKVSLVQPDETTEVSPTNAHTEAARKDVATTVRNTFKLGGSLLVTVVIGFGIKIALRRHLPPDIIGPVNWADGFAATAFVAIGLGFDTHLRKVVPINPAAATEFVGTFLSLRLALSAAIFTAATVYLQLTNASRQEYLLVYAYGLAQFFVWLNNTYQAILHSTRTVDGLSIVNVASKFVWAGGFAATIIFDLPLVGIPLSVLTAEVIKAIVGHREAVKHANLRLTFDASQIRPVFIASAPFFVNGVANTILNRFDVNVLKHASTDAEIGLYSAASELAQMTFILAPMFGGVLMPLFARSLSRSVEEYRQVVRRALEFMLMIAIPPTLFIALGADFWVQLLLGDRYVDSALSLRVLSPAFLLTYVAVISAIALNLRGGEWTVTATSILGMFINPLLVIVLVGPSSRFFGAGGAGAACAFAQVGTETLITCIMLARMGRDAFDRRSVTMLLKTAIVCGIIGAVDYFALQSLGPLRLVVDALLYVVLVLVTGAVNVRETVSFVKTLRRRGASSPQEPA